MPYMENLQKEHEQLEVKHESLGRSLDSGIAAILKTCHDQGMAWDDAKKKIACLSISKKIGVNSTCKSIGIR